MGKTNRSFHGLFREDAHCRIYNLHGGLHLFEDAVGDINKAIDRGAGVIATITDAIFKGRRFPVYVAEGFKRAEDAEDQLGTLSAPLLRHACR